MIKRLNEIYIFDEKFNILATIDNFEKVVWEVNFFEADTVDIKINFDVTSNINNLEYEKNKALFDALDSMFIDGKFYPRFIACDFFNNPHTSSVQTYRGTGSTDVKEIRVCFIETYKINETDQELEIKGRGFLSIFDYKHAYNKEYITDETITNEDFVGMVACRVLNDGGLDADTTLQNVFVADENNNKVGIEVYYATEEKQSVYEAVTELLTAFDLGFETIYNQETKKVYFKVIDTTNRKIEVAISKDDDNLLDNEYEFDIGNYRNYLLLRGTYKYKENGEEKEKTIGERIDNSNGGVKFTMIEDSKNKQMSMTEIEYKEVLKTEAKIILDKETIEMHYDIKISNDVDVQVGDTCVVKIYVGYREIAKEILITSIEHTFTKKEYERKIGFGKPYNAKTELKKTLGVR